jgi:hypothetical protein
MDRIMRMVVKVERVMNLPSYVTGLSNISCIEESLKCCLF